MRNNKGITIVEIIISVTLIAIIMLFLYTMLITVRNENERSKSATDLLIKQAMIIKTIQNDFIDNKLIGISSCRDGGVDIKNDTVRKIVPASSSLSTSSPEGFCLKFSFADSSEPGYLLYYNYTYANAVGSRPAIIIPVIGYKRGDKREIREVCYKKDASGVCEGSLIPKNKATVTKTCTTLSPSYCSVKINMPIYNEDGEDYGIYLSYLYNQSSETFNYTTEPNDKYNFNRS